MPNHPKVETDVAGIEPFPPSRHYEDGVEEIRVSYFTANQFVLTPSPLRLTTRNFYFPAEHLRFWSLCPVVQIWCWFSKEQSLSVQSPRGLMTIIYCLRYETPPTWRAGSPYLYPPGAGWPSYTPRHWVPPTTRRVTVEVFEPASTLQLCKHLRSGFVKGR
jgi:hypothetical protein